MSICLQSVTIIEIFLGRANIFRAEFSSDNFFAQKNQFRLIIIKLLVERCPFCLLVLSPLFAICMHLQMHGRMHIIVEFVCNVVC
jgi:hypothetical protein